MPTVDLRFVVHNRKDIDLATKSLVAFNKVSVRRQSNYDAEAAAAKRGMTATERLIRLEDKLIKQRLKDNLVGEARTQQIEAHERILQQEIRTLQDYIDTDKVLEKEQKAAIRTEANLAKQREKTKNDTEKLRMTYDSTYAATKRYKQGLKDIDRAFEGMEDGPERASRAIKALKADYKAFIAASKSGQIVDAGNQFARYGDQAYRAQQRTKRFASVGLQQAGYQVNDFIVQVASGQNALVAFGQQGSQLAGIFGTGGAVVGAVIAAAAAIGNLIYQTHTATNDTRDFGEVVDDLKDSIETLVDSMEPLDLKDLGEQYGSMAGSMARMADSVRDLNAAIADSDFRASLEEYAKQSKGSIMSVAADMLGLADAAQRVIDISPTLLAVIAPRAYKGYASAGEEAGKAYAEDLAKGFGTGVSAADVEKYFQQLLVAEQSGTAGDAARIIEEFEEKIRQSTGGFTTLTMSGQRFVQKMQELREEYSQLQSAIDGSGLLQASQNRSNEASAKAIAAARKKALKLQADIAKATAKIAKDQKKAQDEAANARIKAADVEYQRQKNIEDAKLLEAVRIYKDRIKKENEASEIAEKLMLEGYEHQADLIAAQKEAELDAAVEVYKKRKELQDAEADRLATFNANLSLSRSPYGVNMGQIEGAVKIYKDSNNQGSKGKKSTTMEGPIKALERQIELSKALFGLEGQSRREQEVYMQLKFQNQDADIKAKESQLRSISELVAEEERRTRVFEEQKKVQKEVADTIANSFGSALTSIVDGTKSVKDAFKDMAKAIINDLYQIYVVKMITGMISGGIDDFMSFNASAFANGNVFRNGNLVPYADGGVVGGPTYFPMNDGRTGLMGEAGPEAIMPLKRGKNGKLGVQAEGGSGDVIIHQNFNFQANGDESVKKIIAQQAPAIASMTKKQILDDRRRGGQMKQAFG
tara:strand:+ start:8068 stop:10860 length:2793 start_codon:yes stop_codon:yes gene_type:complete